MARKLRIDVVSDVVCPWCAVGVAGLEAALAGLGDEIDADLTFHPFELNPGMPPGGENGLDHVARKYGLSVDQVRENRATIAERAAAVGFEMNVTDASRIVGTFDAHRLIAWAGEQGRGPEMERRLLAIHFTERGDVSDAGTLAAAARSIGLDGDEAGAMLASGAFAEEVRRGEALWHARGVTSVPTFVVEDRYMISGGQPRDEFERQLRAIVAAEAERALG